MHRGTVGLYVQNITAPMAKGLDLPVQEGVVVADIDPDGPADIAGFKRRDIILGLNGRSMATARQFEDAIYRRMAGAKVSIAIQRGSQHLFLTAEIGSRDTKEDRLASLIAPAKNLIPRLGIFCIEIDDRFARLIPGLRRQYGLPVAAKSPEGQAPFIDLRPGDVIHQINNLPSACLTCFGRVSTN